MALRLPRSSKKRHGHGVVSATRLSLGGTREYFISVDELRITPSSLTFSSGTVVRNFFFFSLLLQFTEMRHVQTSTETKTFTLLQHMAMAPSPRWGHCAHLIDNGNKMIVFGGCTASTFCNDLYILSTGDASFDPSLFFSLLCLLVFPFA